MDCTWKNDSPLTHTAGITRSSSYSRQKSEQKKSSGGECKFSFRLAYIFSYNLFQFCGHTWVLANTIARFLVFGKAALGTILPMTSLFFLQPISKEVDNWIRNWTILQYALADTFYSVGFVMSLCQLFSILELFHIADGIEKARLLPRFVQVMEKNFLMIIIIMLEDIQSKPIVCLQLFFWNVLDLLRYPHALMSLMDKPSIAMLWTRYTLWIPVYILSVATEVVTIQQTLSHFGKTPENSSLLNSAHVHLPWLLMVYLPLLALGASVTVWQLLKERKRQLEKWNKTKKKR